MIEMNLLSILINLSLGSSVLVYLFSGKQYTKLTHWVALLGAIASLIGGGLLFYQFDVTQQGFQFQESWLWITRWNIHYALGIDGISLMLILLTILITSLSVLTTWHRNDPSVGKYLGHIFLLQGLMIASFSATDGMLFYICWEALLIPMTLMIGIWGSAERAHAAIKFFIYTFLGSALMLVGLLYLGNQQSSPNFMITHFYSLPLNWSEQLLLFSVFFLAFAVKIPLFPLHTWLPEAHTEAPTEGSMILAALMLKLGGYGVIRFCLPIFPDILKWCAPVICALGLSAVIYASLIACVQQDMKKLIAYSSIAHMGMMMVGIFAAFSSKNPSYAHAVLGVTGSILQMIAHGMSSAGLFLGIGILYQRFHSRMVENYSGLAQIMPTLATGFMIFSLSSMGLPGTAGFVGEYFIILSAVQYNFWIGLLAASTLILSVGYLLLLYSKLFWGILKHPPIYQDTLHLSIQEQIAMWVLVIGIFLLGIWPMLILERIQPAVETILKLGLQSKL